MKEPKPGDVVAQCDSPALDEWGTVGPQDAPSTFKFAERATAAAGDSAHQITPDERYEIIHEVARGGMGILYIARHRLLDKQVALKVCLHGRSEQRFLREAQVLAKICSPHVVRIYDFAYLPDGRAMIAMEWLDQGDLYRAIKNADGKLNEEQAVLWMRDTCTGMAAAAAEGIIHRDLKPSNVLIDNQLRAQVADFGLARCPTRTVPLTETGTIMGTPEYMAPEQAEDAACADTRSDIYSFGATFYHALTGAPPFHGKSAFSILYKHKTEPLTSPKAKNPALSDRTCEVLERCLAKSPGERFESFEDIITLLEPTSDSTNVWEIGADDSTKRYWQQFQLRRAAYLSGCAWDEQADTYNFPGARVLRIVTGDIVDQQVDAVVSSDDCYLNMGGGVSRAILLAGGSQIKEEADRYVYVRPGRAVITSAGALPAKFVIHSVTMGHDLEETNVVSPTRDLIFEIMNSSFYHCDSLRLRSIAFPLLGTGTGRFPHDVCLDAMFQYLCKTLMHTATPIRDARLVLRTR